MVAKKTGFSRKLYMAFSVMLAITLALSWYFYDSVEWFEYDLKRITIANTVLNGHRALSAQTAEKLNLIDDGLATGAVSDTFRWNENTRSLRASIADIRQALTDENALRSLDRLPGGHTVLNELESLVEAVISSGEVIMFALETQRVGDARVESEKLYNNGTVAVFNDVMKETLALRTAQVSEANKEVTSLAHYITGVLPVFMLALAGFTALVAWLYTRSLTLSVKLLHHGVRVFKDGDLNHRIPELAEKEFAYLGEAFNIMAGELADHRIAVRDTKVRLESAIEERTRALRSSNEMLGQVDDKRRKLLADISHEFRTPLTVIRGEAEIALRGKHRTKEEYQETLTRIMEQADQTTRLVDDLLFIARADAGESRLNVHPVSMGSLLGPVCRDFSAKAEQKEISIRQSIEEGGAVVVGDAGRLRQVFSILLDNALRYSNPGSVVEVGLQRTNKEIIVSISDSGIGLSKDEARQVFERFYRGGRAQSHASGTGLGLPVAKAIIEAHGGSITLEGESGKGAVATVVLPAENKLQAVA